MICAQQVVVHALAIDNTFSVWHTNIHVLLQSFFLGRDLPRFFTKMSLARHFCTLWCIFFQLKHRCFSKVFAIHFIKSKFSFSMPIWTFTKLNRFQFEKAQRKAQRRHFTFFDLTRFVQHFFNPNKIAPEKPNRNNTMFPFPFEAINSKAKPEFLYFQLRWRENFSENQF